jgi:hypothetical protein
MEHIAAVFRKHAIEQGPFGAALLPSVRVEEALREARVRDLGVGESQPRRQSRRRQWPMPSPLRLHAARARSRVDRRTR